MKSRFLSKINLKKMESFSKDFMEFTTLPPEVILQLPEISLQTTLANTSNETSMLVEAAAEKLGIQESAIRSAIAVSEYLMRHFLWKGEAVSDDPNIIAQDLVEMYELPKKFLDTLKEFLLRIKNLAEQQAELSIIRRAHAQSTLPNIKSLSTAVDFRAIFNEDFSVGQNLDDFSPQCYGVIPVGLIQLELSEGSKREFYFQASKKDIRLLIDCLRGLEKQIEIAKEKLNLKGENEDE